MLLDEDRGPGGMPGSMPGANAARPSWREAHRQLARIARRRAALDADEARWLIVAREAGVHRELGYGSFVEYLQRLLGYEPRTARERVRVAEALEELPACRDALARGALQFSAVRELTRVAVPETEQAWLAAAANKTVREIEDLVRGRMPGDAPTDRAEPDLMPRKLALELTPEIYAEYQRARRHLEEQAGGARDDSAVMAALCRAALDGAATSETRPRHQIAVTVCARCDAATVDAAGRVIDVGPEALAQARCDAARVGRDGKVTVDVPRRIRRLVERRDHGRCTVPGCRSSIGIELHHIVPRAEGGDHAPEPITCLCTSHHHAHHAGKLRILGRAPDRLRFEQADGRPYGTPPPQDRFAEARAALRRLGFSAAEATRAVEDVRARATADERDDLEHLLRACLRACRPPST